MLTKSEGLISPRTAAGGKTQRVSSCHSDTAARQNAVW